MDVTSFSDYMEANSTVNKNIKKEDEEKPEISKEKNSSNKVSSSDDSSDEEESCRKAPIELVGEFLHYVRTGNWLDAKKLCGMILIYEPKNSVALNFKSVIDERIKLNEEMESESEEETSSSEDEDFEVDEKEDSLEESSSDEDDSEISSDEDKRDHLENPLCF